MQFNKQQKQIGMQLMLFLQLVEPYGIMMLEQQLLLRLYKTRQKLELPLLYQYITQQILRRQQKITSWLHLFQMKRLPLES